MDFNKLRKHQGLQGKAKVDLKTPESWDKTQGVVRVPRSDNRSSSFIALLERRDRNYQIK